MAQQPVEPQAHHSEISTEFSRDLKLLHITMMGVGMMIGAGVFLGIGRGIGVAGPGGLILTFALNGVIALMTAMSYAELSSAVPRAGGAYNFARIAFGRGTSFMAGWMEWFASSVAGSMYAVVFAIYTVRFFRDVVHIPGVLEGREDALLLFGSLSLPIGVAQTIVALLAALSFLYINYRGASETGKLGAIFTLGQMLTLAAIALAGVVTAVLDPTRLANFKPFLPHGWTALLATMGFTYVAFEGFEVIAQAGDEAEDPRRNVPKAMIYSILIVVVTYVVVAFASVVAVKAGGGIAPWQWIAEQGDHGDEGFGAAVGRLLPWLGLGNLLVPLTVICASTSALNATIYSATRACYALGRDRMVPAATAKLHPKRRTPYVALAVTGALVITVIVFLKVKDVACSASMMFLFLFFLVNLCVIRVRRHMGDELTYGFVMPLFPLLPIAAIVIQAALAFWMVHVSMKAVIVAVLWVLSGLVLYVFYSRHRAVTTPDEIVVLKEQPAPPKTGYRVLVSVGNPQNALSLVSHCYRFCRAKNASVEVIHMVPVPPQVPLRDAHKYSMPGEEAIVEAMLYLAPQFTFGSTMRYCRNIARGILSAATQKRTDLLILGWAGRGRAHFRLGSTLDPILERAPCHVAVFRDCGRRGYRHVLVPFAGGPNSALALETAATLADEKDGRVTVCHVTLPGRAAADVESFLDQTCPARDLPRGLFNARYVPAENIVEGLLAEADEHDVIVIGASGEKLFQSMAMGTVPEEFARRCDKPLVMVKAKHPIKSWVRRWI